MEVYQIKELLVKGRNHAIRRYADAYKPILREVTITVEEHDGEFDVVANLWSEVSWSTVMDMVDIHIATYPSPEDAREVAQDTQRAVRAVWNMKAQIKEVY